MAVTAMWAEDQVRVATETGKWCVAAIVLVVVATTVARPSHLRLLLAAFVVGAVVSVGLGLVDLVIPYDFALEEEGDRLKGGGGDANYLAAGLVSALVLAGGLASATPSPLLRWVAWVAAAVVAGGIAATQSRGGLIALGVAAIAAIVLFRQRRPQVLAFTLVVAVAGAAWFTASPTAWTRIVTTKLEGTGRADLWTVGLRMFRDHPVAGVGMHNYSIRARDYVREPGSLESVELIADRPHEPHNVFLGLLAETGIVGLMLYLAVVLACLAAMRRSIRAFEALGERGLTDLSRAVLVATIGALIASAFIPNGGDKRLFVLMALGPAMLGIAAGRTERRDLPDPREAGNQGVGPVGFGPARSRRPAVRVARSFR
jgi:O-antigen ligase